MISDLHEYDIKLTIWYDIMLVLGKQVRFYTWTFFCTDIKNIHFSNIPACWFNILPQPSGVGPALGFQIGIVLT